MVRVVNNPELAEEIKKALKEGKCVVIAQSRTTRFVKADPKRFKFVAMEGVK